MAKFFVTDAYYSSNGGWVVMGRVTEFETKSEAQAHINRNRAKCVQEEGNHFSTCDIDTGTAEDGTEYTEILGRFTAYSAELETE